MKKTISVLLILVMCLSLCACGGKTEETAPQQSAPKLESSLPGAGLTETEDSEEAGQTNAAPAADPEILARAREYVGRQLEDFIAEFGEPVSSEYASSCLGDGEDGLLTYDGFTVETYKEGDSEEIKYVD